MAFSGTSKYGVDIVQTSPLDDRTPAETLALERKTTWADGTGADAAEAFFHDERVLASSTNEDIDLNNAANAITDAFGTPMQLTAVKLLIVHNKSGNGASITVGPPAANGWVTAMAASDVMTIPDGGTFSIEAPDAAGYVVTATSADLLTITNLDGVVSATYSITLVGKTS